MTERDATGSRCYGLDIGGSKIELVAFDAAMRATHRRRIDTPHGSYDAFLDAVCGLVAEADAAHAGQADADGVAGGAADGYPSMFGAILGTGAGGGYCVEGRLLAGSNGIAGEWGHWSSPAHLLAKHGLPLLDCGCGLRGCLERYVSGSGMAALHRHLGGASMDAAAVIAAAQAGDEAARRALDIHLDLLGHAFASLVMAVDPHVFVLGGGLSGHAPLYAALPAAAQAHLFAGMRVPPILPPRFGDAGGARGAALLAHQRA